MYSAPTAPARASFKLSAEEQILWIALRLTPNLGPRRAMDLLQRFGSPGAIFQREAAELEGAGIPPSVARSLVAGTVFDEAVEHQRLLASLGVSLVTPLDSFYPPLLRQIFDPPILLFARGRLELLEEPSIAVVGTRRPSAYGIAVAERFSKDLATAGLTIASGLARGIDTAAHRGALDVEGNTIAVLGCGIDVVYPAENKRLMEQIAHDGLVLSEFPLRTPGYPQNFPVRNRIVSGLSYGVLIVEGAQYSGSAITARLALDQGREVFAIPGNITAKQSWGPNLLIRQGAHLVQEPSDVLCDLPLEARQLLKDRSRQLLANIGPGRAAGELEHPMAKLRSAVMKQLKPDQPVLLDDLLTAINQTGLASNSELIAILFELELEGLIRQLPGKSYVLVWQ